MTSRRSENVRVAFQGERGAFSEEAAVRLMGQNVRLVPRPTFESLFAAINDGGADYILAPVENSLAGSVHWSYDLLLENELLHIAGEVVIPVRHCLIACAGASFDRVRAVQSHPVALAQCAGFFAAHPRIRRVAAEDTAGSVAEVVKSNDHTRAAIAGRRASEVYGGVILREGLEDHPENYTRFFLLAPSGGVPEGADKLSLVLKLAHKPGSLLGALEPFARRGVDLLKIESRPIKGRPWEYHFYLDLQASTEDERVVSALSELNERAAEVRVLGCYPSAKA